MRQPGSARARASSFGDDMRGAFGGTRAAEVRELHQGAFSVVEVRYDGVDYGRSATIPEQDSVLVCLQMRDTTTYDIWEDGKRLDCLPVARGMMNIYDLRGGLASASAEPIHA